LLALNSQPPQTSAHERKRRNILATHHPSRRSPPDDLRSCNFPGEVISSLPPAASSQPTILIAEDHPDSREALRTLLEAFGYQVLIARNGREAVESALEHQPELVLMDVMMPEIDGLEATRRLRASPDFGQVPILALTAMEGAARLSAEAGCDECIAKPINIRAFLDRVRERLERGRDG
jgi:CheY-like chemotaxis protein